jgi:hypothetical protein
MWEIASAALALRVEGPPSLQRIPEEWAEAANAARGLCESEANRWQTQSPGTSEHWRSVATRLGALYLSADHLGRAEGPQPRKNACRCTFDDEGHRTLWPDCPVHNAQTDTAEVATLRQQLQQAQQDLADAEQQLSVLRPGGTYAWKTRAEAAEAQLAQAQQDKRNADGLKWEIAEKVEHAEWQAVNAIRRAEAAEATVAFLRQRLTALAAEWRTNRAAWDDVSTYCADELDAALASLPTPATMETSHD